MEVRSACGVVVLFLDSKFIALCRPANECSLLNSQE